MNVYTYYAIHHPLATQDLPIHSHHAFETTCLPKPIQPPPYFLGLGALIPVRSLVSLTLAPPSLSTVHFLFPQYNAEDVFASCWNSCSDSSLIYFCCGASLFFPFLTVQRRGHGTVCAQPEGSKQRLRDFSVPAGQHNCFGACRVGWCEYMRMRIILHVCVCGVCVCSTLVCVCVCMPA